MDESSHDTTPDLQALLVDTAREALRSWRLPASLILGGGFGAMEYAYTRHPMGAFFGLFSALYTLVLGPLAWRALVPLEEDGDRWRKLRTWSLAAAIATVLFAALVLIYRSAAAAAGLETVYVFGHRRELLVAWLLFLIGGWGLARDIQLEQRHDRTVGSQRRLARDLAAAQLDALRADLDPHFLFNALNAIASQCATEPAAAEANVCRLATLLRAVLDSRRRPLHALDDELALAADYVALLEARFPALRVVVRCDDDVRAVRVPPLLLQPLLENAVRHGQMERGPVTVTAAREGFELVVAVSSAGPFRGAREGGMGLDLVHRRVALAWGGDARFDIGTRGDRTVATVRAPLHPPEETP